MVVFLNQAQRKLFRKILSLTVSISFIFTSAITPAFAGTEKTDLQKKSARVDLLTPPEQLGTIVDAHIVSNDLSSPLVIQIQDLHANLSVQTNIAKLMEFYDSHLPAYKVAIEGAEGPLGVTQFAKVTDRAFKTKVCDRLMKEAEITGTEYFSIVNGKPDLLWGVEDERYHKANISLFQTTYLGKQQIAKAIAGVQNDLLPIKDKVYTRTMRKLDKTAARYEAGKISSAKFTSELVRQASKQGIDIARRYPEIAKWTGYAKTEQYANMDRLMTEQSTLLKEVQAGLAKNGVQRNVASAVSELDVLKRLMTEEVTTAEVRTLAPQLAAVAGRAQYLLDNAGVSYDKKNLASLISASLDFYAVALLRDKYLAENALKLMNSAKTPNIVLVAGGFHTPGITRILKEKGISYITVAPNVASHTDHDKKLYVATLMGRHANPADLAVGNTMLSRLVDDTASRATVGQTLLLSAQKEGNRDAINEVLNIASLTNAKLPDYTGSGNTSIHKALAVAKKAIEEKRFRDAGVIMMDLIPDLGKAQMANQIEPLMEKWNARYPSDLDVDLLLSDIPAALDEAVFLSRKAWDGVSDAESAAGASAALPVDVNSTIGKRVTATVLNYNIGHLSGHEAFTLTDEVLEAARTVLEKSKQAGDIKDYLVYGLGQDLQVQITSYGLGVRNPMVHALGLEAAKEAVLTAKANGLINTIDGQDFFKLSPKEQIHQLQVRYAELPFTERGAEPIFVSKAIGGGVGFYNQALVNLFFGQKVSNRRLEGAGFFVTVENVQEIREGKKERRILFFGDKPEWPEGEIDVVRPNSPEPLHVKASEVKTFDEMSVLIGDPNEWVITAVYGAKGRMAQPPVRVEPIAVVGVERAIPDAETTIPVSPVLLVRQQGGAPAIGENHMATTEFYFGVGGEKEGYYTGLLPVTLEQARSMPDIHMVTKVVGYHYQSKRNGEIPQGDIYDQNAADQQETQNLQRDVMNIVREAAEVHDMVPFMTTERAEAKMASVRTKTASRFQAVPDYKNGDTDNLVQEANAASHGRTLSDIKADVGGKVGHTVVPSYYVPVAEASLEAAKRQALIDDYKVFYAGDDLHLLISHSHGIDSVEAHTLAWQTFMRIGWVAYSLGDKWYGLMQDFPNMRGRSVDQDAKLNEDFIQLLKERLPEVQLKEWNTLLDAYMNQKAVTGESPFSGNVQGQGPGFAEINIIGNETATFGIFAADKAGPDAFNVPLWYALRKAVEEGKLVSKYGGATVEVWDIHHAQRALFDLIQERPDLQALLAPTHINSAKRIWSNNSKQILAALSVEKLGIIAGGEYVGKDDPVLIANPEIIKWFFQFARDHFYMTQGNARGSHNAAPKPRSLRDGIATTNSKPVQLGLMVQVTGRNGLIVRDMFDDPSFRAAYEHVDRINRTVWRSQELTGGLVSVPSAQVESNYPLVKMKRVLLQNPRTYSVSTDDVYSTISSANRPVRSLLQATALGLLGFTLHPVIGVGLAVWGLSKTVAGYRVNRASGYGVFASFVAASAVNTNVAGSHPLLMAEEALHNVIGKPIQGKGLGAVIYNETIAEVLPNVFDLPLFLAGVTVMAAKGLANAFRPKTNQVNNTLLAAFGSLSNAVEMMIPDRFSDWAIQALLKSGWTRNEVDALIAEHGRVAIFQAA